jgi:hypothetical protein
MAPRKLFGSLNLEGNVGRGENPNGVVSQTASGTFINGRVPDGIDSDERMPFKAAGPRWNRNTASMQDKHVPKPVSIVATRRK